MILNMSEMWKEFKDLEGKAITYNHYELAKHTSITDPDKWKEFLSRAEVADWVNHEASLLQKSEIIKLTYNASNSRSTGQAQLLNSLSKMQGETGTKDAPIFIYGYIPPDENEVQSPSLINNYFGGNNGA